jgi:hypothetical protein
MICHPPPKQRGWLQRPPTASPSASSLVTTKGREVELGRVSRREWFTQAPVVLAAAEEGLEPADRCLDPRAAREVLNLSPGLSAMRLLATKTFRTKQGYYTIKLGKPEERMTSRWHSRT